MDDGNCCDKKERRENSIDTIITHIDDCSYKLDGDLEHLLNKISPILYYGYTDQKSEPDVEMLKSNSEVSARLVTILNNLEELREKILNAIKNVDLH